MNTPDLIEIERLGGLAGFGPPGPLRSRGRIDSARLSARDRGQVEALFAPAASAAVPPPPADGFRYRLSRETPQGPQSVEVPESAVPESLRRAVKDELV
jgi:hypothetical protein